MLFLKYNSVFEPYFELAIFIYVSIILIIIILAASYFLAKQYPYVEKLSPYECGFEPFNDARHVFSISFFLIAILFIIFDLEIMFFIPWCLSIASLNLLSFWSMLEFLFELGLTIFYVWYVGSLNF